jgi:hypothetical protein
MTLALHHLLLALSPLCFVAACFLPALRFRVFSDDPARSRLESDRGVSLLLLGWLTVIMYYPTWLANPLWLGGCIDLLRGNSHRARILLVLALVASFTTVIFRWKSLPRDEGGVMKGVIQAPLIGFYLWEASIVLALASALMWPSPLPDA